MKQERYIIILAGGTGTRFKSTLAKQYGIVAGKPILIWTIERYLGLFSSKNIIVVVHKKHLLIWKELTKKYSHLEALRVVIGGEQRFHSVQNALEQLPCLDEDLIGIHDGVRPFVSIATIHRAYSTASKHGSGVPIFDSVNTLRLSKNSGNYAIDRSIVKEVQNPQVFRAYMIKKAYRQPYKPFFLDDATIVEVDGNKLHLCEGNYENIKITHPQDIYIAEGLIRLYHTDLSDNGTLYYNKRAKAL